MLNRIAGDGRNAPDLGRLIELSDNPKAAIKGTAVDYWRWPLPVARIERIIRGSAVASAAPASDGLYTCHKFGSNVDPVRLNSLDEVADFLKANPKASVRMNPSWTRISRNLFVDGVQLR
jgi:hypothetical protein